MEWKTRTLAILHVGCFGIDSARRVGVMTELRQNIWSAGGLVATSEREQGDEANGDNEGDAGGSGQKDALAPEEGRALASTAERQQGGESEDEEGAGRGAHQAEEKGQETTVDTAERKPSRLDEATGRDQYPEPGRGSGGKGDADVRQGADLARTSSSQRRGLLTRQPSVSAALTMKEGLIHKVNAGLSGLETNIFFQLMRPRPPQPSNLTNSQAPGLGPGLRSGVGSYPTFSGDGLTGRMDGSLGRGDHLTGMADVRHVALYLRRRRWLWRFSDVVASSGANATRADKSGGSGGNDGGRGGFPTWSQDVRKVILALARSRRADGFVLVERRENEALMVKGIRIMLGVIPGEADGGDDGGAGTGNGDVHGTGKPGAESTHNATEKIDAGQEKESGSGGGGSGSGSGSGNGARPRHGGRGEPRAMRIIVQYRVFEVS